MKKENEFQRCIKKLIEINKEHRKQLRDIAGIKMMGAQNFAREFCTIHINIGRRTGKTEYIKRNATKTDVVVVASRQMREIYSGVNVPVVSVDGIVDWSKGRRAVSTIYIDEPELMHKFVGIIYESLFRNANQTFVLLGR